MVFKTSVLLSRKSLKNIICSANESRTSSLKRLTKFYLRYISEYNRSLLKEKLDLTKFSEQTENGGSKNSRTY